MGAGWQATTLRDIAAEANVSVGLLYRYFPSKRAVVMTLYDELSAELGERAAALPPGTWARRFVAALETSLAVLGPHLAVLAGVVPILVGGGDDGLFAAGTAFSRVRVQAVFERAALGARDAPSAELGQRSGGFSTCFTWRSCSGGCSIGPWPAGDRRPGGPAPAGAAARGARPAAAPRAVDGARRRPPGRRRPVRRRSGAVRRAAAAGSGAAVTPTPTWPGGHPRPHAGGPPGRERRLIGLGGSTHREL